MYPWQQKLHRCDVQLFERQASLGTTGKQLRAPLEFLSYHSTMLSSDSRDDLYLGGSNEILINPFMPTGAFNICCPRDCVSRHNGGTLGAPLKPLRVDSALRYAVAHTLARCFCYAALISISENSLRKCNSLPCK